jgi:hypothetical protein
VLFYLGFKLMFCLFFACIVLKKEEGTIIFYIDYLIVTLLEPLMYIDWHDQDIKWMPIKNVL